ncbi:MAG: hypothetical protein ACXVH7_08915 [Thermoanaerobaculia bacterium]
MAGRRSQKFLALYVLWTVVCVALFFALSGREDPSHPRGRIQNNDAAVRALTILRAESPQYRGYEVVHVAWAPRGEGGTENRWVVLCDRVPHSALRTAVVVELRASDGSLLTIRKPVE